MLKDFLEKLSKKEKTLLFVTAGFISLAFLDAFVLGPILSRSHIMDAEIHAKEETIKRNLRIISFRDSIESEYTGYQSYLDSSDKGREEIIGDLLKKIEVIARDHKIGIVNIQPGDMVENPVFQEYKTSLECEGAFADILAFMKDLEGSEFLFKITKYSMIPKSKGGEILICTMDISRVFITEEKRTGKTPDFLPAPSAPPVLPPVSPAPAAVSASGMLPAELLEVSAQPTESLSPSSVSEDESPVAIVSTEEFLP